MQLSLRPLNDVSSVNSFEYGDQAVWSDGDQTVFYFQLINAALDTDRQGFVPAGRRYMAAAGATLQLTFQNIDSSKTVTRLATQPFPEDGSIWSVSVLATDPIHGSPQILLVLTESGVVTRGLVKNAVKILPLDNVVTC